MSKEKYLISLFTGAGGLDLGLEQAGFTTVIANELEPQACETLRKNKLLCKLNKKEIDQFIEESLRQKCFKRLSDSEKTIFFNRIRNHGEKEKYLQKCTVLEGDIRTVKSKTLSSILGKKELFCIAGGPPCQPFSKAGKQKSLDCTKNGDLFYEFVRLVRDLSPKWFIFENVKGITFTKTDVLYVRCIDCGNVSTAPFEIRQDISKQKKTILCPKCNSSKTEGEVRNEAGGSLKIIVNEFEKLGYRCVSKVLNAADYGAPQIRERLFIIGNNVNKEFLWSKQTHQKAGANNLQINLLSETIELKPWVTMNELLWSGVHPVYGKFDSKKSKLWVKNVVRPHDEPVTWSFDRPSPTIGAHQGAKLAFAPEGIPDTQLYRQQWATKGRKQGDTPCVDVEHQYLTDEELLKLQTFPNWWYLHGTRMQRAFQIGNAVPPLLGKAIGKALLESEEIHV